VYDNTTGGDIIVDINTTVQACNINWLPEFAEWIWAQNYKKIGTRTLSAPFHTATLHWPQYLCTKVLPKHSKKAVAAKLRAFMNKHPTNPEIQNWPSIIDFMNSEDWSDKLDQTVDYLKTLDTMRSVRFDEIYQLLDKQEI
jgi:hypothetical protein